MGNAVLDSEAVLLQTAYIKRFPALNAILSGIDPLF